MSSQRSDSKLAHGQAALSGGLVARDPWRDILESEGIVSVADVLARSTCIRDLPDRSNWRLRLGDVLVHVKHRKPRWWQVRGAANDEASGMIFAKGLGGLPVPEVVCEGNDRQLGAVCGTRDLAPARPLDDLAREGRLEGGLRRRVLVHLARVVATLHHAGAHHRDLYLNHVFVDPSLSDPVVAIIDWDRWGRHRRSLGRWVVKDLAALLSSLPAEASSKIEPLRFFAHYRKLRGLQRGRRLRRFARRVSRRAARMRRHAPQTSVEWLVPPEEANA